MNETLKLFHHILKTRIFIGYHSRLLHQTSVVSKKYKYALDKKAQEPSSGGKSHGKKRTGVRLVEGKALTYFTFNQSVKDEESIEISPKQIAYAEIVQAALEDLLCSKEIPKELQQCNIEITQVEVSSGLSTARVIWKLPDEQIASLNKKEVSAILSKYLPFIRTLLPAYSIVTQTPAISFYYDRIAEEEKVISKLLAQCVQEEKEFYLKAQLTEEI